MFKTDRRTFNIADSGASEGGVADPPPDASGAGDAGAGEGSGGDPSTSAPAFTDWTPEVLTPLVPEGYELEAVHSERLVGIVNESKGDLNKLIGGMLNFYTEVSKQTAETMAADFNKIQTDWQEEMRNDPTYGGAKYDESLRIAKETAQRYGGDGFLEMLRITGAGNNVHMLRLLNEVAKTVPREAAPVNGRPSALPKSLSERLFSAQQTS